MFMFARDEEAAMLRRVYRRVELRLTRTFLVVRMLETVAISSNFLGWKTLRLRHAGGNRAKTAREKFPVTQSNPR
jgi:hypothetical protein